MRTLSFFIFVLKPINYFKRFVSFFFANKLYNEYTYRPTFSLLKQIGEYLARFCSVCYLQCTKGAEYFYNINIYSIIYIFERKKKRFLFIFIKYLLYILFCVECVYLGLLKLEKKFNGNRVKQQI